MENADNGKKDTNQYSSMVAQTIESSGNFINNISNPWFVLALILIIGGGWVLYQATNLIAGSINNLSDKLQLIQSELSAHSVQNNQQLTILNKIVDEIRELDR